MGGQNSGRKKGIPNKTNRLRHEEFNYSALGEELKRARVGKNLTQNEAAELLLHDKYRNRVAGWEQGVTTHNLTIDNLFVLCKGYGVKPSEILSAYEQKFEG